MKLISNPIVVILICLLLSITFVVASNVSIFDQKKSIANSPLDSSIEKAESIIRIDDSNVRTHIELSELYLQKVMVTADPSYYEKINILLDSAEKIDPTNSDIFALRASVEIGKHHFAEGKALAEKAITLNGSNRLAFGLLGDANIELGKYEEAVDAFQKMIDIRPEYSSYIRIAYLRELYGDINGAKDMLELAIKTGSSIKANISFAHVELGKLYMRENLDMAKTHFISANEIVQNYPPALEGLGKVAFFNKNYDEAIEYFTRAYDILPIVQYASDIGDVYIAMGNDKKAKQYYTLALLAFEKSSGGGVNNDLEESQFLSERNLEPKKALEKAKKAYADRLNVLEQVN